MLDADTYSSLSALDIAREVNAGQLSAVEVAAAALELAEQRGPGYGAFSCLAPDHGMADARRTDARIAAGERLSRAGVPCPIKDLNQVAGLPWEAGSAALRGNRASVDDPIVGWFADAGTSMVGKTSVPEFGLPCYTEPDTGRAARLRARRDSPGRRSLVRGPQSGPRCRHPRHARPVHVPLVFRRGGRARQDQLESRAVAPGGRRQPDGESTLQSRWRRGAVLMSWTREQVAALAVSGDARKVVADRSRGDWACASWGWHRGGRISARERVLPKRLRTRVFARAVSLRVFCAGIPQADRSGHGGKCCIQSGS